MSALPLGAALAAVLLGFAPVQSPPTVFDLYDRLELARGDGLEADELRGLGAAAMDLAEAGGERQELWRALALVAELCDAAGPDLEALGEARGLRAAALELLAQRPTDTMRWSALVTSRFLPPFERLTRESWADELAAYDRALAKAAEAAGGPGLARTELAGARIHARVHIDRRWDWLDTQRRADALATIRTQLREHGERLVPGAASQEETVARRLEAYAYELEHLHFGAVAPATTGTDLSGAPLDLEAYRGQLVVVDFWTTFCSPCLALVPHARDVLAELNAPDDERVVWIGINGDPDRVAGLETARRVGMPWRNLWDGPEGPDGPAAHAWAVPAMGWPSVFVLDREGRIRAKLRSREEVEARLPQVLESLL